MYRPGNGISISKSPNSQQTTISPASSAIDHSRTLVGRDTMITRQVHQGLTGEGRSARHHLDAELEELKGGDLARRIRDWNGAAGRGRGA